MGRLRNLLIGMVIRDHIEARVKSNLIILKLSYDIYIYPSKKPCLYFLYLFHSYASHICFLKNGYNFLL